MLEIKCVHTLWGWVCQVGVHTQSSPRSPDAFAPRGCEGGTEDWPSEQNRDHNRASCIYKDVHLLSRL